MTNPYFFGTSDRPLFGVFIPTAHSQPQAVLLCPPSGHEYMRAHWALLQLGDYLARAGFHVFRFDYYGLGDSGGSHAEATLGQWQADVAAAAEELLANTGLQRLSLIGLRLGAALAWKAAAALPVDTLVLWDPVVRGRDFLEELRLLENQQRLLKPWTRPASAPSGNQELLGFPFGLGLVAQIDAVDLMTEPVPEVKHLGLLTSEMRPEYGALLTRLVSAGAKAQRQIYDYPGDWNAPELFAEPLLLGEAPAAVLAALDSV